MQSIFVAITQQNLNTMKAEGHAMCSNGLLSTSVHSLSTELDSAAKFEGSRGDLERLDIECSIHLSGIQQNLVQRVNANDYLACETAFLFQGISF